MGVDVNIRIAVGVKLVSKSELFDIVPETRFGCPHKVTDSPFCPECGRRSQYTTDVEVPKLPIDDEEGSWGIRLLDGRFEVITDPTGHDESTYVCVYQDSIRCLNHSLGKVLNLRQEILEEYFMVAQQMVSFLASKNIRMESHTPSVFAIPYYS